MHQKICDLEKNDTEIYTNLWAWLIELNWIGKFSIKFFLTYSDVKSAMLIF